MSDHVSEQKCTLCTYFVYLHARRCVFLLWLWHCIIVETNPCHVNKCKTELNSLLYPCH